MRVSDLTFQRGYLSVLRTHLSSSGWREMVLNESLSLPFLVALLFICIQILHLIINLVRKLYLTRGRASASREHDHAQILGSPATFHYLSVAVKNKDGLLIFGYSVIRLLGCIALFSLSAKTVLACSDIHPHCTASNVKSILKECPEVFITFTYLYSSILAVLSMSVKRWTVLAIRYNIIILLTTTAVYVYRDIWPLATYHQRPVDANDDLLWFKLVILAFTSLYVPLFIPRHYIPVDSKDPMPVPNDEQTCSLFSLVFYFHLDPVVSMGNRVKHLEAEQLPPLPDTAYSKNLVNNAFPYLDVHRGAKKRHLFFGLMIVFRREYIIIASIMLAQVGFDLFPSIGINRILRYQETGGQETSVRPWFWIVSMAIAHTLDSVASQWSMFVATRVVAHAEALITQLIFEHSLRVRFVADTDNDTDGQNGIGPIDSTEGASDSASLTDDGDSAAATSATPSPSTAESTAASTSASKGKSKDAFTSLSGSKSETEETKKEPQKKNINLIGMINNLVTTDLGNVKNARNFLQLVLKVPLQIICSVAFLYYLLGWSAFIGFGVLIALLPLPGYVANLTRGVQKERMMKTDARVQTITEVVGVLKMVKLFGWEQEMSSRVKDKRDEELSATWKFRTLSIITRTSNEIITVLTMVATYASFTLIMKQSLTASIIFSSVKVFETLRNQLYTINWQISSAIQGKVSIDRISDFLTTTELLDYFSDEPLGLIPSGFDKDTIGFKNATFSWDAKSTQDTIGSSSLQRSFRLKIDDLTFKPDSINVILGPTGSGKTSVLLALLGEMHFCKPEEDTESWFNLPREGGIAYAPQESWVLNTTIRENILFGSTYDEARYQKVLYQCALEKDLGLFEAGDATEVGEKGITLSGGQKARITLARAVYSQAKILLLDDILAALDVHTSVWIVNQCLRGDLLKGRTVLLVTHNITLVAPLAGFIVSFGRNGTVKASGDKLEGFAEVIGSTVDIEEIEMERNEIELEAQLEPSRFKNEVPTKHNQGKLVVAEEIEEGHVTWRSIKVFLQPLGGHHALLIFSALIGIMILADWLTIFQTWFLGYWATQYENRDPAEVHALWYISQYCGIIFGGLLLSVLSQILYLYRTLKASRAINIALVDSVLSSTLRWLDQTPTSRIITRCTQDMGTIDGRLPESFHALFWLGIRMITNLGVVIIFSPVFLLPGIAIMLSGFYMGNLYMRAQLSVKREMSNGKAPILGHLGGAISGIVSIRAYGVQIPFKDESLKRIDHYLRILRTSYDLNRWIQVRIDTLGTVFTAAISWYLVYRRSIGTSNTGFSLNMSLEFCSMILFFVRFFNDFEVESNSVERIQQYLDIDHEPPPTEEGKPPAAWPTSGEIVVENLSARYLKSGPNILHGLSFHIDSGQRVGIVGRTGSGKSSLTLALLRCIVTEGTVYYDGIPTNKVNLDALRSNITIIPQTPELISGTLRRNLDPFEQYDDATLNDALGSAGLFSVHEELGEGRISLDTNISSGGANLSVGEKQIIALARAMVRGSKLLILDEATSAIDYKTDAVIQSTLRSKLDPGVTVITVAHRLQTIMDADKIMVLDEGRIVEFDSPKALLLKDDSKFKAMVDGSGDKEALYAVASGRL